MLVSALVEQDRDVPTVTAVQDPVTSLSFRNLTSLAVVMREVIQTESPNKPIGLLLPSGGAFVGSLFGALWSGGLPVPLNFLLSPSELTEIVRDAGIELILSVHHFDKLTAELPAKTIRLEDLPIKRRVLMQRFRKRPLVPDVAPDALAVLLYTSGTSGDPKGVELTHRNLRSNCDGVIEAVSLRKSDRFLCVLPPFHVFGLTANVLVPIVHGLTVYAIPRFSAAAVFRTIREFKPTVLMAVPSMYAAMLRDKSADSNTFAGFHMLVSGGEPLPDVVANGFSERFGAELIEGYGLTETSPVISINPPARNRRGTVGKLLPKISVRIVTDDGRDGVVEEEGEIRVRGPSVMRGYHNQPAETAAVLDSEGWFATGDIGKLDREGYLSITGRLKDMMIVGGENVFPREIESVLDQHAAIAESAVIGIPHKIRGEVPLAFITLQPEQQADESEIRAFVRARLASHKVPQEIRIVDDLPHGPTGKVAKRKLKAQALLDSPAAS